MHSVYHTPKANSSKAQETKTNVRFDHKFDGYSGEISLIWTQYSSDPRLSQHLK